MKRVIASVFAALAVAFVAAPPATRATALAGPSRRPCSCASKARARAHHRARRRAAHALVPVRSPADSQSRAQVVGPVVATYTLPQNQYFRLRMNETVSSERSRVGDRFKATVVTPVYASGVEVVPAGSIVEGRVTSSSAARTRGREGRVAVVFDTLVLPDGTRHRLDGVLTEVQDDRKAQVDAENQVSGRSSETRNIEYVGGGAVGGAILGGVIGGGKGAGIGAAVGAGAGVAGAMLNKGNAAEMRSGTEMGMTTTRPLVFQVRAER